MQTNKNRLFSIIKLLGAICIIYAGLTFDVKKVGEQELEIIFQDYLKQNTQIEATTDENQHFSADTKDFQTHCQKYSICNKILFGGELFDEEKIQYIQKIDKTTSFINTNNILNSGFTNKIKSITINNFEDSRRGYATRDTIVFNIGSIGGRDEFHELTSHELGHIFDLGFLQGKNKQKHTQYTEFKKAVFALDDPSLRYYKLSRKSESTRNETAKKKDFCSGYGMSNPFEDFAECFNLYLNHNNMFKHIAKNNDTLSKKYNFFASLLNGKYLLANVSNISLVKDNTSRRPRDTTKIE